MTFLLIIFAATILVSILGFIDACKEKKEEPYEPWL
jgi:hypothetical protein